ncbi:MAG: hypothetical protein H7Z42_10910 [Roseiflexaceae bacterium]|nr:hypothetical protein [Roseiflexaceae bacterium]
MMFSPAVLVVVAVAIIGWFATIRAIGTSKLSDTLKRWLLIPSWVPWMAVALGAPIFTGVLPIAEAMNIGGAITAGMAVAVVIAGRQGPRQ